MSHPPPLSAKDTGSFAYVTVKDRMPVIVTNIIDDLCRRKYEFANIYGKESNGELKNIIGQLSALKNEMQTNKVLTGITVSNNSLNDDKYWQLYFDDYRNTHEEPPQWYSAPWIFVECFMYRRIDDIFRQNKIFSALDPFEQLKIKTIVDYKMFLLPLLKYTNDIISATTTNQELLQNHIETLTQISIWGNQCDLSISVNQNFKGVDSIREAVAAKMSNLLVWDFNSLWNFLRLNQFKGATLGIVLDNAGVELICDLCFLAVLMKYEYISSITFYPKIRPYFVSDTTRTDLQYVLENIRNFSPEGSIMGEIWSTYFKQGAWTIKEESFWTGPQGFPELAQHDSRLYEDLSRHSLLIFKGDLNYRKLTGDFDWSNDTPFKTSLIGFLPTNLLVLRTIKGGCVTGLDEENPNVIAAKRNTDWFYSAAYGVAHFVDCER